MPLFDTLSGLDIHVKIQVTPDRVIERDVTAEFEDKLEDMVNTIMKKTVSLQIRDIIFMYLPDKQRNGKKYYMFDIYLYNSTGNIRFSQVITEIKDFVSGLKTQGLPMLSDRMNIGFKVDFGHKIKIEPKRSIVDLSSGKRLTVLKKTAREQDIGQPKYEITNVHWCYRTSLSFTDVKQLGDKIYQILNSSVTVYETEIEEDLINGKIYVCIDLVVTPTAREDMTKVLNVEGNVDINENDANEVFDRGAALVVSCFVLALFSFIFCKVKTQARATKANTDMPQNQTVIKMDTINDQSELQRKDVKSEQTSDDQSEVNIGQSEQRRDS